MKVYKVEDLGFDGLVIYEDVPKPATEEWADVRIVKLEDYRELLQKYQALTAAVPKHQQQFMQVCLERDRLERKVFELQRQLSAVREVEATK